MKKEPGKSERQQHRGGWTSVRGNDTTATSMVNHQRGAISLVHRKCFHSRPDRRKKQETGDEGIGALSLDSEQILALVYTV
jgi:hypothetical protein